MPDRNKATRLIHALFARMYLASKTRERKDGGITSYRGKKIKTDVVI